MSQIEFHLVKRFAEFLSKNCIKEFPRHLRGIYVLYNHRLVSDKFDAVYLGMAAEGNRANAVHFRAIAKERIT